MQYFFAFLCDLIEAWIFVRPAPGGKDIVYNM